MDRTFSISSFTIALGDTAPTGGDGGVDDGALVVADKASGAVKFPAAMTGTKLIAYHKYAVDGSWVPALKEDGTAIEITKQLSQSVAIPLEAFTAPFLRFVSDAAEAAERSFETCVKS